MLTSDVDIGFITIKYFKLRAHGRDFVGLNQIGGYAFFLWAIKFELRLFHKTTVYFVKKKLSVNKLPCGGF